MLAMATVTGPNRAVKLRPGLARLHEKRDHARECKYKAGRKDDGTMFHQPVSKLRPCDRRVKTPWAP